MKQTKLLLVLMFLILLMFSVKEVTLSYSSDVSLNYDGKTKTFSYSKTDDLFTEFKDLMPGDKKTQMIRVNLNNIGNNSKLYLNPLYSDSLSGLTVKIYKDDILLYDTVNNNSKLIKIYDNNEHKQFYLKVNLEVPVELGNELQGSNIDFKWQFIIEDGDDLIDVPQTYADNGILKYVILMILSLIAIIFLILSLRKDFMEKNKK